jgi:hypothetical protein
MTYRHLFSFYYFTIIIFWAFVGDFPAPYWYLAKIPGYGSIVLIQHVALSLTLPAHLLVLMSPLTWTSL